MIALSIKRVRSIIADCKTESEIALVLRSHKIKYSFSTDHGIFQIRIPYRKGFVRIYKSCSRSCPWFVSTVPSVPWFAPVPVVHNWY